MTPTPPSTALSELTEAIVKAVPSVVKRCVKVCDTCKMSSMRSGTHDECCGDEIYACIGLLRRTGEPKHEIRRDITLEDVLRALDLSGKSVLVGSDGCFWKERDYQTEFVEDLSWEHGLSLHQQSEETIDFLYSLLCV